MKTNTKIRLLVAALGGNLFPYSGVRASDSAEYDLCETTPSKFTTWRAFDLPPRHSLSRRFTMTGCLGPLEGVDLIPIAQQERGLSRMIPILIKKHFSDALPAFVRLTLAAFKQAVREGSVNECSLEELFMFSLVDPDTLQYLTRDQRPPRESVAIYGYATDAITGRDGIINRIKRNIMDEILMIIQLLIIPNLPDELILHLEQYVDHLLGGIVPALKRAMFDILRSDMVAEVATGCCGWCRKLKKEDKKNLTMGICHMLGGMLGRIFGDGFERGADELAQGICGIITTQGES